MIASGEKCTWDSNPDGVASKHLAFSLKMCFLLQVFCGTFPLSDFNEVTKKSRGPCLRDGDVRTPDNLP